MTYFLQIQNFKIRKKILMGKKRADEVVYIFNPFCITLGRLGKEVKFVILKTGDILKIIHYFIPLKIRALLWNKLYSFMEMNTIWNCSYVWGNNFFFLTPWGSNVKRKSESKRLQKCSLFIKMKNWDKDLAWIREVKKL